MTQEIEPEVKLLSYFSKETHLYLFHKAYKKLHPHPTLIPSGGISLNDLEANFEKTPRQGMKSIFIL